MKKLFLPLILLSVCLTGQSQRLWYRQPANSAAPEVLIPFRDDPNWLQALPVGNGALGAMVYGGVGLERIQLNEESIWSGSPADNDNPEAAVALQQIRSWLFEGKYKEAQELVNKTQICKDKGSGHGHGANEPFGSSQTLGDLWLQFPDSNYTDYHRDLDLSTAIASVRYQQKGVHFTREVFGSKPAEALIVHLSANVPGALSFSAWLSRPERGATRLEDGHLVLEGALPDGKGGEKLRYMARMAIEVKGGSLRYQDNRAIINGAQEVTLIITASSNYLVRYPDYTGRDFAAQTLRRLSAARTRPYAQLRDEHLREYQSWFNRVDFNLTDAPDEIPTDQRLHHLRETAETDLQLYELLFQYGRYLLISSSRPNDLPAHLQGIWTNKLQTPWNGDYHTDVNVQMNYWPAEVTNLSELHEPLVNLIESLVKPGARTAQVQYGLNGWVVHPITNVWGYTAPGEAASWGMHVSAAAWLCQHLWEHYAFTLDRNYLWRVYPVLAEASRFYLGWLTRDPRSGLWVSGPAVSPENTFLAPDGSQCQVSMGPAHDQQLIRELFGNTLMAAGLLGQKGSFTDSLRQVYDKLYDPGIGQDGRLKEWPGEFPEPEPGHRHMSHMYAVYPGHGINPKETPDAFAAARKSLEFRLQNGGGHTGWSAAWVTALWARFMEGDSARIMLDKILARASAPNLFGQHPPFQIDGNFGSTAAMAEMLLQSQNGELHLLPALPNVWKNGLVCGLKARGDFTVDMEWRSGDGLHCVVYAAKRGLLRVRYGDKVIERNAKAGKQYSFNFAL